MKQTLMNQFQDLSEQDSFCFALTCGGCGRNWISTPKRFSKSGATSVSDEKQIVYSILYQREHKQAQEEAAKQAVFHFNRCPVCERLVCNDCFVVCEDLDMCCECAERLNEKGESVYLHTASNSFE